MTGKPRKVAIREWTCPHHPDGPPTLPADGYEREELTVTDAYEPDGLLALRTVVDAARAAAPEAAATVEEMLGLCCIGHRWKTVGYREVSSSDETVATLEKILREMPWKPFPPSVLLAEWGASARIHLTNPLLTDPAG